MIKDKVFSKEYASSLKAYLDSPSEALLHEAYKLARLAIAEGIGVLELVSAHQQALSGILREEREWERSVELEEQLERATEYLSESLSPFEIAHKSFLEANAQLRSLTMNLEKQVEERTNALKEQEGRVRFLLQKLIAAQEKEREQLAKELHDDAGHLIASLRITLDRLSKALPADAGEAERMAAEAQSLMEHIAATTRRVIAHLHPAVLDELGLVPALQWLTEKALRSLNVEVRFQVDDKIKLPREAEVVCYRIAQTAIDNIVRYSQAKHVSFSLQQYAKENSDIVVMIVKDDGKGFDPSSTKYDPRNQRGLGLANMRERATVIGGRVEVESAPGKGTTIEVSIPLSVNATVAAK